jgi:hypothetical protein
MRNADDRERSAPIASPATHRFASLTRSGIDTNESASPEKYSGSSYYPEIAPISPHFVETTFSSSHTMMEARTRAGLIASPEARIVDPRHASNRLLEEAQSAARRRITRPQLTDKREKVRDERFGRSPMSPATTGGWIANFVDHVP